MEINGHSKLVCTQHDKNCVAHIRNKKQALKHGLKLKKVHKAIAFYQEAWLKPYIEINTELRKNALNAIYSNYSIMPYLVKVCRMQESIEILSL